MINLPGKVLAHLILRKFKTLHLKKGQASNPLTYILMARDPIDISLVHKRIKKKLVKLFYKEKHVKNLNNKLPCQVIKKVTANLL